MGGGFEEDEERGGVGWIFLIFFYIICISRNFFLKK